MPKFAVTLDVQASVTFTVPAKDEQDAAEKVAEIMGNPPMLCPHCAEKVQIEEWVGTCSVKLVQ